MEGNPEADPCRSGQNTQLAPEQKAWEALPIYSPKKQPRPGTPDCRTQVQHFTGIRAPRVGFFLMLTARCFLFQVTEHLTQTGLSPKEIYYLTKQGCRVRAEFKFG